MAEIDVGQVIAGKYELVRLLGKGAMGQVWLATHSTLGGEFAVKLVRPDEDDDATAAARFQLEAQISAKLSRKTRHVVAVSDHGEEDGLAYLVMELLEGESLDHRIERGGPMELHEVAAIVTQIARALSLAHGEGIFHRDLKPANVFLTRDEDGRLLVKLVDFGIARARAFPKRSAFATAKDMVLGTPSYMSPEQARGLDSLDHRCDVWGLAVVAYEALTTQIPFEGETVEDIFLSICTHRVVPIRSVRADLPPAIDAFYERAFAPKLDDRFSSAPELCEAFLALADPARVEAVLGAPLPSATSRRLPMPSEPEPEKLHDALAVALNEPTLRTRKKRRGGWIVAAAAALTVAVAALGLVAFSRTNRDAQAGVAATTAAPPPPATVVVPPPTATAIAVAPSAAPTEAPAPTADAPPAHAAPVRPHAPTHAAHTVAAAVPAPPAPPASVAAPPPAPPSPAPAPTPKKKPIDKGEVF